jgi:hypothetical protein
MDKLEAEVKKGDAAETLLETQAFKDAEQSVRAAIFDKWATSPLADIEGQHELRLMLKLLDDLLGNLRLAVSNGKFSCNELEIKRTLAAKR